MMASPALTAASLVVRRDGPLSADVGGRTVLMSLERGNYYDFDPVGSDLWRRLAAPTSVAALCASLAEDYVGEPATIEADVLAWLARLAEHGLITVQS